MNRKLLSALAEVCCESARIMQLFLISKRRMTPGIDVGLGVPAFLELRRWMLKELAAGR